MARTAPKSGGLGNLCRLKPLHVNELPYHANLQHVNGSGETPRPSLPHFIVQALLEAHAFADDSLSSFNIKGIKPSAPSSSEVEILSKHISKKEIDRVDWHAVTPQSAAAVSRPLSGVRKNSSEYWVTRRSRHRNECRIGTASFPEFDRGLRLDHSENEMAYTPDVYDCHDVLNWNEQIKNFEEQSVHPMSNDYSNITMNIREMCHAMKGMNRNRTFPVVIITAKGPGPLAFITVQIPVDVRSLSAATYSNKLHRKAADLPERQKKVEIGNYTSIEICRSLTDGSTEWLMCTASHAKGWIPQWIQRPFVAGFIKKDVGLYMDWINNVRNQDRIKASQATEAPTQTQRVTDTGSNTPPPRSTWNGQWRIPDYNQPASTAALYDTPPTSPKSPYIKPRKPSQESDMPDHTDPEQSALRPDSHGSRDEGEEGEARASQGPTIEQQTRRGSRQPSTSQTNLSPTAEISILEALSIQPTPPGFERDETENINPKTDQHDKAETVQAKQV